jgi:hypothetical protein
MTPEQKKDLLIEWSIYNQSQQKIIENEYHEKYGSQEDENHWLNFLKNKLEMESYWRKAGLK